MSYSGPANPYTHPKTPKKDTEERDRVTLERQKRKREQIERKRRERATHDGSKPLKK